MATELEKTQTYSTVETGIAGPLILWITFLLIGVILSLVVEPLVPSNGTIQNLVTSISNWILYLPGCLILPLIVSIWIGEGVGKNRASGARSAKIGEINGIYTSLIYVVSIFIIYLLFYYIDKTALANITLTFFLEFVVAIPVIIVLVLTPIVSALSAIRHTA